MNKLEILINTGLSEVEAKVYLSLLETGPDLYSHVAERIGIKRPTLYYDILPSLIDKGLLEKTVKGKRKYLVAQDPQQFLDTQKNKLVQAEQAIPELRTLLATASDKPSLTFYEGVEGIKKVWFDHLIQGQPILEFAGIENIHSKLQKYIKQYYVIERSKRKIPLKMLISGPAVADAFKVKTDPYEFREVKTIDEKLFPIPLGCDIYGDNVSFTLHRRDSEPIGLIIRSKEIAITMRSLFNFIWNKA